MKKLFRKALALSVIALLFSSTGNFVAAQQNQFCGTDEIMQNLLKNDPDVRRYHQELEAFTQEYVRTHRPEVSERGTPQYIIPLVFHIIHDNGVENLSDAMIDSAVAILNRDFQKLNSDTSQVAPQFKHLIGDANIEFRLARKDPDGNCTDGIDRVFSYRTYQGNDLSKVVIWDRKHYLNIWTVYQMSSPGVAAYAYLPAGAMGLGYKVDGVISWYDYVRYNGPGPATLTHEIGHSFNLSHPWGGGQVGQACGDDGVEDTPVTNGGTNCPTNRVDFSCDSDPINKTWQFDSVTTTSGQTAPYPFYVINPNTPDTALTLMNFKAVGVSANSSVDSAFSFSGWGTGGVNNDTTYGIHSGNIDLGKYYEFTVRPQLGQGITLTGIRFWVKRSDYGPRMFSIRSSETSNFGLNLTSSVAPANPNLSMRPNNIFYFVNDTSMLFKSGRVTLSGGFYTNIDDTVTFRIYAWNAEDSTGTFEIDSVAVTGTFGTIENLDNYMDYTYCDNMFTIGQTERMHAALESNIASRNNLWTNDNHALTGIFDTTHCPPQADFYVNKSMTCQNGLSVQFSDNSTRGKVNSWLWSFPNGTPSSSTLPNPTVVYNAPYSQSVTLTVRDTLLPPSSSSTITKDNVVWVSPTWATYYYTGLFYEDFEDPARFNNLWMVDNRAGNASGWHVSIDGVFPSGSHGVKLNAYSPMIVSTNTTPPIVLDYGIGAFDRDAFITPNFDLSEITPNTGKLEFKLSGATRGTSAGDMTDTLEVFYSINCGNTWASFATNTGKFYGSALSNAGSFQESYSPTLGAQWVQKSINLPTPALNSNVRFRFRYISGYSSNNIYIDDFNISGAVGVKDNNPGISADLSVYPNPASGDVSVNYRLSDSRNVTIQVFDAIGNLVYNVIDNKKQVAGNYTASFSTSKISNGIYHVKLSGDNVTLRTEKVAVIR